MKNKPDKKGIVYSTDPDYKFEYDDSETFALPKGQQKLYLRLDRLKGGKLATVVENYISSDEDKEALAKELKQKCGVGGSVKDGEIILQGDHRDKVLQLLISKGFQVKKKGG
ncbi:MAG: translation initiation factor [Chitinophagales bacterium]|nr:translation initiation factor [Chitinophagales bacterium]MDW8272893.1 translation initiation factor [Chitinophagales bacterium]